MPTDTGPDLAGAITARRTELEISVSEAARIADVARPTWDRWEKGFARPSDSNYRAINRVLQWEPRQGVENILAGRDPVGRRNEHSPPDEPPAGINPKLWARWDPIDREMIRNMIIIAEKRARKFTRTSDSALMGT